MFLEGTTTNFKIIIGFYERSTYETLCEYK